MRDSVDRYAGAGLALEPPVPEPQFSQGDDLLGAARAGVHAHPAAYLEPAQRRVNARRDEAYIPDLRVPAPRRRRQRELFEERLPGGVADPRIGDRYALDEAGELAKLLRHRLRYRSVR